jgi:hypothetical protein
MARKIRIEYAGATYHVMTRGNQGREHVWTMRVQADCRSEAKIAGLSQSDKSLGPRNPILPEKTRAEREGILL